MALSQTSYRKLKAQIAQWEATTGRKATPSVIRGFAEAELQVSASRQAETKGLELQTETLQFNKDRALASEKQRLEEFSYRKDESARDFAQQERQYKDSAKQAEVSGYVDLAKFGYQVSQTDTAQALGSYAADSLGFGAGTTTAQAVGSGASAIGSGAFGGGGVQAVSSGSQIAGSGVSTGLSAASNQAVASQFGAGVGSTSTGVGTGGSATGAGTATGATTSAIGVTGTLAAAGAAAGVGSYLATSISGDKNADVVGSIAGGFTVAGPVGGVIGAIYAGFQRGEVQKMAHTVRSEIKRTHRKVGKEVKRFFKKASVICCELCNQDMLDFDLVVLGAKYREEKFGRHGYYGYLKWAKPVVKLMKKSKIITYLFYPVGAGWAKEAAHRMEPNKYKGCWYGKVMMKVLPWFSYKVADYYRKDRKGCR